MTDDVLAEFDALIADAEAVDAATAEADPHSRPWRRTSQDELEYVPNTGLLVDLLSGPMRENASTQSGRLAKAFDAWMAYELRRAAFHPAEVWPRNKSPRVSSKDIEKVAQRVEKLTAWVAARDAKADIAAKRLEEQGDTEALAVAKQRLETEHARLQRLYAKRVLSHEKRTRAARAENKPEPDPLPALELPDRVPAQDVLLPGLRPAIQGVVSSMPNVNATNVLGRFYVKQVDVVVGSWERGPDLLISGKTMFSSFAKNTKNRYEETLGEASNLRDRYPLAAMGYAFLVSDKILGESGAYGRLQDLLIRTRKPYGPYDATLLLIATWDETTQNLSLFDPLTYPDPIVSGQQPPVDLSAARFFTDLLNAIILNTPVGVHDDVRVLRSGTPIPGGTPDLNAEATADAPDDTSMQDESPETPTEPHPDDSDVAKDDSDAGDEPPVSDGES